MSAVVDIAAALLTALVMAPALAHALELPGKRRLDEEGYRAVQKIYYPGFTIAGFLEVPAAGAAAASAAMAPPGTTDAVLRWAAATALIGLVSVYWLVVHPVNREWLRAEPGLSRSARSFFGTTAARAAGPGIRSDASWLALRRRWEVGHVVRSGLAILALTLQVVALPG